MWSSVWEKLCQYSIIPLVYTDKITNVDAFNTRYQQPETGLIFSSFMQVRGKCEMIY
jgi:hypothetical protein